MNAMTKTLPGTTFNKINLVRNRRRKKIFHWKQSWNTHKNFNYWNILRTMNNNSSLRMMMISMVTIFQFEGRNDKTEPHLFLYILLCIVSVVDILQSVFTIYLIVCHYYLMWNSCFCQPFSHQQYVVCCTLYISLLFCELFVRW